MIADQARLDDLVSRLADEPELGIDCEMDAMYAYRTSLCLLQVGWRGGEALIDAMADLDRSGLAALFADDSVVKIFHGGENDIGLMAGHWGMSFENVFDTMAAAQVVGRDGVGLAALLKQHFDVSVSKKFQKADWRVRPLPEAQAEYARIDVRYLIPLRAELNEELDRLGRAEEAQSEFRRIAGARAEDKPFDPDRWARVKGLRKLPAEARGVLRELYVARDAIARELDRAPYRVMNDSVLLTLAARPPADLEGLQRVRGVPRGLRPADAVRLVKAIEAGKEVGAVPLPRKPRGGGSPGGTPEELALFDALRAWRVKRAEERGVQVARVATNALLSSIARRRPTDRAQLADVRGMEDWRLREYGDEILGVVREHAGG